MNGANTDNLYYDGNGNLANGDDVPTVTWSTYNKPTQLTKGSNSYQFVYGTDRRRYQKTHNGNDTHYVGGNFEKIWHATDQEYRHVIRANGKAVMVRKDFAGVVKHIYIHRDHLGSVTAVTDESTGAVLERYSYDAWGKRRSAADWTSAAGATVWMKRGYTGHEHLDDIGIIHMNDAITP